MTDREDEADRREAEPPSETGRSPDAWRVPPNPGGAAGRARPDHHDTDGSPPTYDDGDSRVFLEGDG